ncbi:MAG: D-alanyl-D-alanine carboxypeptidase/D-alanyl-D-alanine-endopeptidase [Actinomycetes bacterium]
MITTHRKRQRIAATALGVVGATFIGISLLWSHEESSTAAVSSARTTPVFSPRRLPANIIDTASALRLKSQIESVSDGSSSCFVVEDAGNAIIESNPNSALRPASAMKLVSTAAVVDLLGPGYKFTTRVVGDSGSSSDSLTLIGSGDPVLSTPAGIAAIEGDPERRGSAVTELSTLADHVVAAGVRSLPKGIVVDDHVFDERRYNPAWPASYRTDGEIGPIGALSVDSGWSNPSARTASGEDPALAAGLSLAKLLRDRGVKVGGVSSGRAAEGAETVADIDSPRLDEIVKSILSSSNNHGAEMLVKAASANAGKTGSTADGIELIKKRLSSRGVNINRLIMLDGSGLARQDAVSCRTLEDVLHLGERPRTRVIKTGLAVAGVRGTLAPRLVGTELVGHLVAKTGTLNGVSALAGHLDVRRPLLFALILNGSFSEQQAYAKREAIAKAISRFPDAPISLDGLPLPGNP